MNFFKKIAAKISFWYQIHIALPIRDKKLEKIRLKQEEERKLIEEKNLEDLKENFKASFGVDHKAVIKLINDTNELKKLVTDSQDHQAKALMEGRKVVTKISNKGALFYEPEFVNLHNEYNILNTGPSFEKLKHEEYDESKEILKQQELKEIFNSRPKAYKERILKKIRRY